MKIHVILAAAGSGSRMNADRNKIFLSLFGETVLEKSIRLFSGLADSMSIVCREEDKADIIRIVSESSVPFPVSYIRGGQTRQESVLNALKALSAHSEDIVLVHDAARCLTPPAVINNVISSCKSYGSGVPAIPAVNTMKYVSEDHRVISTIDRNMLYEIQTPQGFIHSQLIQAYMKAEKDMFNATDDASVVEHSGIPVHITEGSKKNIKITEKEDLSVAESFISGSSFKFRIGTGFDVHRLVENRKLILCGIEIPHKLGLLGHSDADVGIHALMDAMLGAAAMGDIGKLFPDSSEKYRGISSLLLLKEVGTRIRDAGYTLVNADITLVAQQPKISPYIPQMIGTIADTIGCMHSQISIKATTTEKLGFEGREEGISAQAVCLLQYH